MDKTRHETQFDENLFAELYDVQPQAITWFKPVWADDGASIVDFEFAYSNNEALNYFNLSREVFRGLRVSTTPTLSDELRKTTMEDLLGVYHTGKQSAFTFYNPVLNKYSRVLRAKLRGGVLNIIQNITEERRIIRQLDEQKSLVNNILTHSTNGISVSEAIRDAGGRVVDAITVLANDAAINHTGLPREVYLSKRATEIDPGFVDTPYFRACVSTLETGVPFVMQYKIEVSGRWLELTVSRMDADHLIHVFTDITPIKEAQLQSEQAAERLAAVFNASQSGMFIFAPEKDSTGEVTDFRFVITNPAFAAYVGQTPEGLKDQLGSTFFPGYLHNGVFDMYKQTYLTGETLRRDVHYQVDGHDLYLDLRSTKVQDEVLVTFTDHTAIKRTQFELEKLVEDLRKSNTRLEEFAHAASHDLKEPIRKVRVFSDRIQVSLGERMKESEQQLFARMQNATERMTLLVDDLLTYSQVSLTATEMEDVNLGEKIQMVLTDLEVTIEETGAGITVAPLPVVRGHRRQLQQLFQNLLSNGLKYRKPGQRPQITISASVVNGSELPFNLPADSRYHLVAVSDNGIGFEQEYADRIFQIFQRLHGRSEYAGTGIGLAIARKVVENHQGYIWAESEPGKGATFNVLLPV
ncbi:MAG TPA: ATP-binding protein [Flavisolibacter sp.]|jgi:signal transduction histidine kinase|nr:ATP-binding protein [Flavisolibacter sp.]